LSESVQSWVSLVPKKKMSVFFFFFFSVQHLTKCFNFLVEWEFS
jgi:hypothetical protein